MSDEHKMEGRDEQMGRIEAWRQERRERRRRRTQPVVSHELRQQWRELTAAIKRCSMRRVLLLLGISVGVTVWILAITTWLGGREQREQEAFRREITQQLTTRLSAEEIEQIREEARPVTSVNQTVYVDRDMTPSEYSKALRWGQWEGEQKAKRQEQENRLRWDMVRVAHGLTKTEMTMLCGPQP